MITPSGFFVDMKAWDTVPVPLDREFYDGNPPDDWEQCDCCECYHPPGYTGDCRGDINRWPSQKCIDALKDPKNHNENKGAK